VADPAALDFSAINPDCFGKIAYASRAKAEEQRHRHLKRGVKAGARGVHAYLCPACGSWHIAGSRRLA
jgi:hypothetical protein